MTNPPGGSNDGHRSPQEIAELFEIAGRENEAIRALTSWVEELQQVQAAKESLKALTPAEVRAALEYRRMGLSNLPKGATQ